MNKLLLMSSMAMMVILPVRAARFRNPRKGLKRAVATTLLFNLLWAGVVLSVFAVMHRFYPHLLVPQAVGQ